MRDDGGSAFPQTVNEPEGNWHPGMTLRDYFAAMAMQGSLAAFTMQGALDSFTSEASKADPTGGDRDGFAQWCYGIADAMLAERAKDGP